MKAQTAMEIHGFLSWDMIYIHGDFSIAILVWYPNQDGMDRWPKWGCNYAWYSLVNTQKAIENGHLVDLPIKHGDLP